jgi:hypothetical protein
MRCRVLTRIWGELFKIKKNHLYPYIVIPTEGRNPFFCRHRNSRFLAPKTGARNDKKAKVLLARVDRLSLHQIPLQPAEDALPSIAVTDASLRVVGEALMAQLD